jgi:HlyD family secretion protein
MLDSPQREEQGRYSALKQQSGPIDALDLPGFFDDFDLDETEAPVKPKVPWWRRPIALIAAGVLVVLIAGLAVGVAHARRGTPITYTSGQVSTGDLIITASATGPLQSATYDVNFSGSGTIKEIDVSVGQQVKSGQLLAKLDPTSLQDAVNSAQTALNNANINNANTWNSTQAQLNSAYNTEQNAINPTNGSCNSNPNKQQCMQTAEDQFAVTQAQVNSQRSSAWQQVTSAQAALTTAKDNLGNATVYAPHAGIVGAINGKVGGTPGASSSSGSGGSGAGSSGGSGGSAFIEIVDLTSMQVTADVNEADIGKIADGQAVAFTVSAYPNQRFRGTVSTISPLGQTSSNVVTYPVTINVDMASLNGTTLLPDMTANVTITTSQRVGVLLVPAAAITFARSQITAGAITRAQALAAIQQAAQLLQSAQSSDPTAAQDNLTTSFVLERTNGKWAVKPVILGLTNGTLYEVVAGLSDGESIVTGQQGGSTTTTSGTGAGTGGGLFFGGGRGGTGGGTGGGRGGNGGGTGTGG